MIRKCSTLFLCIIICINFVIAQTQETGESLVGDTPSETAENIQDRLDSGQDIPHTNLPHDINVNPSRGPVSNADLPSGADVESDGDDFRASRADSITTRRGAEIDDARDIEIDDDGSFSVESAGKIEKDNVLAENVKDADFNDDGSYSLGEVDLLSVDDFVVNNGRDVEYRDGIFKVGNADSISVEKGFITLVRRFEGDKFGFWVESAESVRVRCLTVLDVIKSEFTVYSDGTQINPFSGVVLNITDCSGQDLAFVAGQDSEASIREEEPIIYTVKQGNLTFEGDDFSETVWVENYSVVMMDLYDGFSCMDISPVGTYFYSDRYDKRKDFSISIPAYGSKFRLCVRKDAGQHFSDYDGLVDLVDASGVLNGVVDYLRYPLMDDALASLVLEEVYQGLALPMTKMSYDTSLVFLDNVSVQAPYADTTISLTIPSNYYWIKEEPVVGGVHTLVKINTFLDKGALTDNIIRNYGGMSISNNVLLAENVRILAPGHGMISEILG